MTDRDTIARLRAEQRQHAARRRARQQAEAGLGPDVTRADADYWELMPNMHLEDWSGRIREAEREAEWLPADDDRWPSGWYVGWLIVVALAALLALAAWGLTSAAAAQTPDCKPKHLLFQEAAHHGFTMRMQGTGVDNVFQVWDRPDGRWLLVQVSPHGWACIRVAGAASAFYLEKPALAGDPT